MPTSVFLNTENLKLTKSFVKSGFDLLDCKEVTGFLLLFIMLLLANVGAKVL